MTEKRNLCAMIPAGLHNRVCAARMAVNTTKIIEGVVNQWR